MLKHLPYDYCKAELTLTMSIEQSTYLAKASNRKESDRRFIKYTSIMTQSQSFLHFFAVVPGVYRVGKSITLLGPISSKESRTSFSERPFLKFSKTGKRFHCHMSHRKRDDENECIINFMIICTNSSKCTVLPNEDNF